jgi:lipopolysaccharide biosynthesis glycosyltransferase
LATFHVACAVEGGYDVHSAALLHSIVEHSRALNVEVHYLHGPAFPGVSRDAIVRMLESSAVRISFTEIPPEAVAGLPVVGEFTAAMWYRILLPDLLPHVDRVLYLDVDTIVADSLDPLVLEDLTGHYLAAVTNVFQENHLYRPRSLGLPGPDVYFNSGVLLMNLDEMRRDGCSAALRKFAVANRDRIEWPDQDALNVVLGSKRLALHPRWNVMNSLRFPWSEDVFGPDAVNEALRSPAIRHFEGPGDNKPWHYMCERDGRELYLRHRRATPWPRLRPEGRTARNVARRLLHRLRRA